MTDLRTVTENGVDKMWHGDIWSRVHIHREVFHDIDALIASSILSSGLSHECSISWATGASRAEIEAPDSGWTIAASLAADRGGYEAESKVVARDVAGNLLVAVWRHGHVLCRVFAATSADAELVLASVQRLLPQTGETVDATVSVTFWNYSDHDVERTARRITVPEWDTVRDNYNARTRGDLERLMRLRPDAASGKLILWHGPPGTGKTWALRSLLREWRPWADAHYVLDPEKFFGQSASYMMSVILDQDGDDDDAGTEKKWRLLVLEDAGELLGKDARLEVGQGLARMLNVCDGLVGQGLRVLILLTTNEDVGSMHPAVVRRARCLANIRFDLLSPNESRDWAVAHGVAPVGERSALLADLFATDQIGVSRSHTRTGFQPRASTK
jgi:hypothetical protein